MPRRKLADNSSQTLAISGPNNGTLFVKDFEDGKLGIRLSDAPAAPPAPPSTTRAIRGDLAYLGRVGRR